MSLRRPSGGAGSRRHRTRAGRVVDHVLDWTYPTFSKCQDQVRADGEPDRRCGAGCVRRGRERPRRQCQRSKGAELQGITSGERHGPQDTPSAPRAPTGQHERPQVGHGMFAVQPWRRWPRRRVRAGHRRARGREVERRTWRAHPPGHPGEGHAAVNAHDGRDARPDRLRPDVPETPRTRRPG